MILLEKEKNDDKKENKGTPKGFHSKSYRSKQMKGSESNHQSMI